MFSLLDDLLGLKDGAVGRPVWFLEGVDTSALDLAFIFHRSSMSRSFNATM